MAAGGCRPAARAAACADRSSGFRRRTRTHAAAGLDSLQTGLTRDLRYRQRQAGAATALHGFLPRSTSDEAGVCRGGGSLPRRSSEIGTEAHCACINEPLMQRRDTRPTGDPPRDGRPRTGAACVTRSDGAAALRGVMGTAANYRRPRRFGRRPNAHTIPTANTGNSVHP